MRQPTAHATKCYKSIVISKRFVTMAVAEQVATVLFANFNPPPQLCLKENLKEEWTMFKRLFMNYIVITKLD